MSNNPKEEKVRNFEISKRERKTRERFLNESLKLPYMEAKGAYSILADVLKLEHLKENIFEDKSGEKFALTKYGFQSNLQFSYKLKCSKLEKQLEDHNGARLANFQTLSDKIKKLENRQTYQSIRKSVVGILDADDDLYKKLELIEKLFNY